MTIKFGIHTRNDGTLIDTETGLLYAIHFPEIDVENTEDALFAIALYRDIVNELLASEKFRINPQSVAPEYRAMYEEMSPAIQSDNASPSAAKEESKPVSNEAVEAVLKVHQMTLDKGAKTAGQKARAVYAIKTTASKDGKKGLMLLDEKGEKLYDAFWDNSDHNDEKSKWKNPYSKWDHDLGAAMWKADKGTTFFFNRPAYVAISENEKFTNFQRVLQFDGEWSTNQF